MFRCPSLLNRGVCLIKVSFKVNKGNKFWDFGYCPLNKGCLLNTGFTVVSSLKAELWFPKLTQDSYAMKRQIVRTFK